MQLDFICWFLLALFIGVFADPIKVERGHLVCLFKSVTADNTENEVSLYVNGVGYPTIVVTFKFENDESIKIVWKADNYSKIFMDAKRNIWIANMDETYERKFYIQSTKIQGEVELTISSVLSETSSSQIKDRLSDCMKSKETFKILSYVFAFVIIAIIAIITILCICWRRKFAWILRKKRNKNSQEEDNGDCLNPFSGLQYPSQASQQ